MSFKIKALTHTPRRIAERSFFSALPHTHRGFLEGTEVAGEEGRGGRCLGPLLALSHSAPSIPILSLLLYLFFTTTVLKVHKREIF
jgi:hypothetical protein